ncbi:MAG: ribosome maturation factor RimP [Gammaproteobacteria bacterium]|jgi:ribosome maturation factor RimP
MYRQNRILVELLEPVVTALGYEMLGVEHHPRGQGSLLRIYIDKETGIGIKDCTRVSQQLTGVLDVEDPVRGAYDLEVSSPGLDRPLFTLEHFRRFVGRRVRVHLYEKLDGRKRYQGEIVMVNDDQVSINDEGKTYNIPAGSIERARLVP